MKRFLLKTLGCKVNQYESQAMREILQRAGFTECLDLRRADIFVLNTCTVTGQADKEARYLISRFHNANPKARIIVTGCYAENDAAEIEGLPGVAKVIGNKDKARIASILTGSKAPGLPRPLKVTDLKGHDRAFVKIQDGCDNYCSYCKVPLIRPDLDSRPIEDIVDEVKTLAGKGFKEIVLTGINLGAWGREKNRSLADVLRALEGLKGNFRIRLSSIEPKYVDADLIRHIAGSKKVCKHLHIPFQSGDNSVLKKMNRPYTSAGYIGIIRKAKAGIRGVAITTDILIGFPGETERQFKNTLAFVKKIGLLRTHIFTYSPRKGTAAYRMGPAADKAVLKKRYLVLKEAAEAVSRIYRKRFAGKMLDVLVESKRDRATNLLTGYSDNYIRVVFKGPDNLMGKIAPVKYSMEKV